MESCCSSRVVSFKNNSHIISGGFHYPVVQVTTEFCKEWGGCCRAVIDTDGIVGTALMIFQAVLSHNEESKKGSPRLNCINIFLSWNSIFVSKLTGHCTLSY